jgi:hypothetical protein
MAFYYKKNGTWKKVQNAWHKENGSWRLIKNGYKKVNGSWERFHNQLIKLTYSADANNVDIFADAGSPELPVDVEVVVESGVCIGSYDLDKPALKVGTNSDNTFVDGSRIKLINKGNIVGAGGLPGQGGGASSSYVSQSANDGGDGGDGGPAVELFFDLTLDNQSLIAGGGGGGGGGGGAAAFGASHVEKDDPLPDVRERTAAASSGGSGSSTNSGTSSESPSTSISCDDCTCEKENVGYGEASNVADTPCQLASGTQGGDAVSDCSLRTYAEAYGGDGGAAGAPGEPGKDGEGGTYSSSGNVTTGAAAGAGGAGGQPGIDFIYNGYSAETV